MNILVLGGNGYLGSKIVRMLKNEGHMVVCTKRPDSDLTRVSDIEGIKWIPASEDGVEVATEYLHFDYLINAACNYGRSNVLYGNVIEANIEFPLRVINKLVEKGTKKYLTIGTGLPSDFNMYSFSKKMLNEFGRFYVEKQNVSFVSLQLEMFYGSDEPEDRFLPSIIRKMILGKPVDVTLGTQKRDIIFIEDIVKAIKMVVSSEISGFNEIQVGTGNAPTISEIINYIWECTGKSSEINWGKIPMRENEPDCIADISSLCAIGEWNPVPWKEGIRDMIEEIRRRIK